MDPKLLLYTRGTPFSGAEGDNWDAWIGRFEARTSQLSDTEKLHVLLGLLEGRALDTCGTLPKEEQLDYSKVKSALEAQFGTEVDALQAFSAFSQATRQPGESAQAFGERLKRLAQWTYQDQAETNEQVIQTVVNRFICGIQEPWLQRKLFVNRPKDLDAAVRAVKELHRQQDVVASLTPGPGSVAALGACPTSGQGTRENKTRWRGDRGEHPGQQQKSLQPTPVTGSAATPSVNPAAADRTVPNDRAVRGPPRCFGCNEVGHIRRFCPNKRLEQRDTGNRQSPWCLCCGEDGHWMAECRHYRRLTNYRHRSPDRTDARTKTSESSQTQSPGNW